MDAMRSWSARVTLSWLNWAHDSAVDCLPEREEHKNANNNVEGLHLTVLGGTPLKKGPFQFESRRIYVRPRTGQQSAHSGGQPAAGSQRAYSLGWDRQTDGSRHRLMPPPLGGH